MRYILYFFTLALVFTAGMLIGNFYIPDHSTSVAAAVAVPELESNNPALLQATEENAQQALSELVQALSACPVVVSEEKDSLLNRISLFLTLQDFQVKKAVYEAEIAKNSIGTRTTNQFSKAATDYNTAKARVEQQVDALFPQSVAGSVPTDTSEIAVPTTAASTATVASKN